MEKLTPAAAKFLAGLAAPARAAAGQRRQDAAPDGRLLADLLRADLVALDAGGLPLLTPAGRAHLARRQAVASGTSIGEFRAQHLSAAVETRESEAGRSRVTVDQAESPLVWLARRRGRDGRPLIEAEQLQAGERLRADFTRAQIGPRVTAGWDPVPGRSPGAATLLPADAMIAARQRLRQALDAAGPEFSGLLLDVCCFLKRLEDVERERLWPARSAKLVLQLGLDRLARHYGLGREARGRGHAVMAAWVADTGVEGRGGGGDERSGLGDGS